MDRRTPIAPTITVVPTGALDLALWMIRRWGTGPRSPRKFRTSDVVLNERSQNYENRHGLAGMAMSAAMFASDHPYHGRRSAVADLRQTSPSAEFFTYYHPANASLVLAGDIETSAFDLADSTSGDLPAGPDRRRSARRLARGGANLV